MMDRHTKKLSFDANLDASVPPDTNATDFVMIHTIIDASMDENEPLMMHGKKLFNTDRPAEPVTLKDSEIVRIAYQPDA